MTDNGSNTKVSIVTPVYNASRFIQDTIKMVCNQTYTDWELILVDDASPDGSAQLITRLLSREDSACKELLRSIGKSYENSLSKVKLISKDVNEGAALARNTGIDAATGRYIAFLDADDIWMSDKLTRELEFMEQKKAGFAFSAYEFGDENAEPTGKIVHVPETLTFREALSRTVIFTTTVVFDLNRIDRQLIHMPNVGSEDTATWWTILKSGVTAYGLDEVLAIYRRPAKSLSSNKFKAIQRIWFLYRNIAGLSVLSSVKYFIGWALRAVERRI